MNILILIGKKRISNIQRENSKIIRKVFEIFGKRKKGEKKAEI